MHDNPLQHIILATLLGNSYHILIYKPPTTMMLFPVQLRAVYKNGDNLFD